MHPDGTDDYSSGGVPVLIRKSHVSGWLADFEAIIPARVVHFETRRQDGDMQTNAQTAHFRRPIGPNGSVSLVAMTSASHAAGRQASGANPQASGSRAMRRVSQPLKTRASVCELNPQFNVSVLVGGFNSLREGEQVMQHPTRDRLRVSNYFLHLAPGRNSRPNQRAWQEILNLFQEIPVGTHTHVNIASSSTSQIDRICGSFPPRFLWNMTHSFGVGMDPMTAYVRDFTLIFIGPSVTDLPPASRPPEFRSGVASTQLLPKYVPGPFGLPISIAVRLMRDEGIDVCWVVFRAAAQGVREFVLEIEPDSQDATLLQLATISRAVGPIRLTVQNNFPKLLQPAKVEAEFAEAKLHRFDLQRKHLQAIFSSEGPRGIYKNTKCTTLIGRLPFVEVLPPHGTCRCQSRCALGC